MYITTYTGKKLSLIDPQPEDICTEDIAHHLSQICRYNGACNKFYSVAQHSVLVYYQVPTLQALFHDAGEAYYGDFSSPFKQVLEHFCGQAFRGVLEYIDKAIFEKYNIPWPICPEVKKADGLVFSREFQNLMPPGETVKERSPVDLGPLVVWPSHLAKDIFQEKCRSLHV